MANTKKVPLVCGKDGRVYLSTDGKWCPACGVDNTHDHAELSGQIIKFSGPVNNLKELD